MRYQQYEQTICLYSHSQVLSKGRNNMSNIVPYLIQNILRATLTKFLLVTLLAFSMSACQVEELLNNNSSNTNTQEEQGELTISLTDAPGDFVSYTVDVQSIMLTKADGTKVQTLPLATRIDFSQYVELTEFLTAATVPNGVYKKASMVIDYLNADIQVEDENGNAVPATVLLDIDGNPITSQTLNVQLDNHNALPIMPGVPAHLTLDFDLKASHRVEFDDAGQPTVTMAPVLIATVDPETPKIHRARGALKSVDLDNSEFQIFIRPFLHKINKDNREEDRRFGSLDIQTNADTLFEINGESYRGKEGLAMLDTLDYLTAIVAKGELKFRPRSFIANEVRAGSSVAGETLDAVSGTVLARSENTLTVNGATLMRQDGSAVFNDNITVLLADSTIVKRQLDRMGTYDIDDISVGQKVAILGRLSNDDTTELDASNGRVSLLLTALRGSAVIDAEHPAALALNLRSINHRNIQKFDFTGTGIDLRNDAAPDHYELDTGSLDISNYQDNDWLKAIGFVTPYGEAPADFIAQTIVSAKNTRAVMAVNWRPGSARPFSENSAKKLVLNLNGTGKFHHIAQAQQRIDLTSIAIDTSIVPSNADNASYIIQKADTLQIHRQFAAFTTEIQRRLNTGSVLVRLHANGDYNKKTSTLTAKRVKVRFK